MASSPKIVAAVIAVVVVASGVGIYWEWFRPTPSPTPGCPTEPTGNRFGSPPVVYTLNPISSWRTSARYTYNISFAYVVATASTNWTAFDLINRTFQHSLIDYTVTLLNSTFGAREVFNASHSGWRSEGGRGPSEALDNWTPTTGARIGPADVLQVESAWNLTASGLYMVLAMAPGACGDFTEQPFEL